MLELASEQRERVDPARGLAIRCALALGVRREVVDVVLRQDVVRAETTALGWMRRLLDVEMAMGS